MSRALLCGTELAYDLTRCCPIKHSFTELGDIVMLYAG